MAVIFTYPLKSTLVSGDLFLISDSEDGNKTKNTSTTSIKDAIDVVDTVTASGVGITASPNKGDVVIANTGVTSLVAGSNIDISGTTGAITISTSASNVDGSGTAGKIPKWSDSNTLTDSVITDQGNDIIIPRFIKREGETTNAFGFTGVGQFIVSVGPGTADQFSVAANAIIIKTDSGTKLAAGPSGITLYNDENGSTTTSKIALSTYDSGINVLGGTENSFTRGGAVRFYNSANNRYVGISGPTTTGTNYEIILPDAVGLADQVLKLPSTIGSTPYQLAWGDASGDVYTAGANIAISGINVISATNTTYTTATSGTLGLVKIGYTQTATRDYPVTLNSEKMLVTVPWTDTVTPVVTASQGLTKTSNNITLDIADPTTGWAILGGGAGATTQIIGGSAGANATGTKNFGISSFITSSTATSADQNVAVGFASMGTTVSTASRNVVVGYEAGESMTTALENVLVGYDAGAGITDGGENTIIGSNAGETITTGDKNTIIGSNANAVDGTISVSAVAIGRSSQAATKSVAVGSGASANQATSTAIGNDATVNAANGIAIGQGCAVSGPVLGLASALNPINTPSLTEPNIEEYLTVIVNGVTRYIALYSGTP